MPEIDGKTGKYREKIIFSPKCQNSWNQKIYYKLASLFREMQMESGKRIIHPMHLDRILH